MGGRQSKEDNMADDFIDIPQKIWERIKPKITSSPAIQWTVKSWTYDRLDFQINYSNLAVQSSRIVSIDITEFKNCTDVEADETWQRQKNTTDTYKWTNTTGFKIGGVKFPIDVPTQPGLTLEYSSEHSTEQTTETGRNWQLSTTLHVPAHVKVSADWSIHEDEFETDFVTVIHPVNMVLKMRAHIGSFSVPDVVLTFKVDDILSPGESTFVGSGTFKGIQGNRAIINATQSPASCPRRLVLGIESGVLSPETQQSLQTLNEIRERLRQPG
jgi:hypothetical protein